MKRFSSVLVVLAVLVVAAFPVSAQAAGKKGKAEVVMKIGSKVHLFHSSKVSAQKEIAVGDVLQVYRQVGGKDVQPTEVGKVKVLSLVGDHYLEAEIVSGEAKVGDVAKKKETSLLVQPTQRY